MSPEDRQHVRELFGTACRCGTFKRRGDAFCRGCYFSLPKHQKRNLQRRIGEGYAEAYRDAAATLDAAKGGTA